MLGINHVTGEWWWIPILVGYNEVHRIRRKLYHPTNQPMADTELEATVIAKTNGSLRRILVLKM